MPTPAQPKHEPAQLALTDSAARQLANATKSRAQLDTITRRWLVQMLPWVPVEAGIYRLNRVKDPASVAVSTPPRDESELTTTYVGYYEAPREYFLSTITTIVDIHTRVSDLYSSPFDQIAEQIRLTVETVKERQESELINSPDYGLLANVDAGQRISTLTGPPTPDDLDQLITKVWKDPAFFLAHPLAIAAFGRECTRARCTARHGQPVRFAVPHLAGTADRPVRQSAGRGGQNQGSAAAGGRAPPGRHRLVPARLDRRAIAWAVGALHGHQPQRHRVLPGLSVLLAGGANVGRARSSRRCRSR